MGERIGEQGVAVDNGRDARARLRQRLNQFDMADEAGAGDGRLRRQHEAKKIIGPQLRDERLGKHHAAIEVGNDRLEIAVGEFMGVLRDGALGFGEGIGHFAPAFCAAETATLGRASTERAITRRWI